MSLSTPLLTTSSEIDTRVDDCSATDVVMKDDADEAKMMSVLLIVGLLPQDEQRGTPTDPIVGNFAACCARRERPRGRTAEKRYELAPSHSFTSSARTRNDSGSLTPRALAVVSLMIRSNLLGCSTGMSPGFVPRRILST